jgi:Heavy-metal resistance
MTQTNLPPPSANRGGMWRYIPKLLSRWWTLLLGLSLMANLLIGGLALGHRFGGGGGQRMAGITAVQLVPRQFFADLPRERRLELLRLIRENARDLRSLRDGSAAQVLNLAAALEKDAYNPDDVRGAVAAISTGTESLAARGAAIVIDVVSRLTPDERKALAAAIRDRAQAESSRRRKN